MTRTPFYILVATLASLTLFSTNASAENPSYIVMDEMIPNVTCATYDQYDSANHLQGERGPVIETTGVAARFCERKLINGYMIGIVVDDTLNDLGPIGFTDCLWDRNPEHPFQCWLTKTDQTSDAAPLPMPRPTNLAAISNDELPPVPARMSLLLDVYGQSGSIGADLSDVLVDAATAEVRILVIVDGEETAKYRVSLDPMLPDRVVIDEDGYEVLPLSQ